MTGTIRASGPVAAAPWQTQLPPTNVCDIPLGPQQACEQLGQAATDAAGSALDDLAGTLMDAFTRLLRMAMTWWTDLPSPQLTTAGEEPGAALSAIRDYSSGLQVLLLTTGIMFAAARLALAKRGGVAGEAQESFLMLARAVFASMAFAAVITAGTRAGDAFADWVILDASSGDWTGAVNRLTQFDADTRSGLGTGVLLLVGLLGVISTLIQLVMLVVRQALLILVVAVIPLAAAASGTGPGSQAYKKLLSWSLAFVLYKPVGALVYAIAFTVIGNEKQRDPQLVLLGLILLVMSVVVLPALIRLVAPAVATLGGGGGAAAVLAGGAAGVAMASMGDRSSSRKVSEGENAPGGGGVSNGSSGPGGGPGGGGGGGRPMSGGSGDSGSSFAGAVSSGGGSSGGVGGGGARPTGAAGARSSSVPGAGSGGEAAGAAGAGPMAPLIMGAQMAKDTVQQGISAIDSQTRDATEGALDPDALGPGEVRR
ncbi:hypothetical protein IU450_28225 [Nocardia abscessus]|uniref:hypothetical protein n=1 Tax=Nocardia abscessus TaxID=120957 RepID=UPI0018943F7A|nr:hypothetical protein [Nocardia abscessus]MBF6339746.1 hypothetical protein [Nocardia abscessus]